MTKYILFILFGLFGLVNLYIGSQHLKFYQNGVIKKRGRISAKILNDAIKNESKENVLKELKFLKSVYIANVTLIWIALLFAICAIINAANK